MSLRVLRSTNFDRIVQALQTSNEWRAIHALCSWGGKAREPLTRYAQLLWPVVRRIICIIGLVSIIQRFKRRGGSFSPGSSPGGGALVPSPDRNRRDRLEDFTKQMSAITDDNFQEFKDDLTNLEYYAGWDPLMLDINLLLDDVWDALATLALLLPLLLPCYFALLLPPLLP